MKTVTSLLLVALLVASAYAECVTRGPADVFVGDHTPLDYVLECNGERQSVALPPAQLGGYDATTFEAQVFLRKFSGCVASYGSGSSYVALGFTPDDTNPNLGQIRLTVGNTEAHSNGVLQLNKWHNIAIVVGDSGDSKTRKVTFWVDGFSYSYESTIVDAISSASVAGHLGFCANTKTYLDGAIDNFIITAKAKTSEEILDTTELIFPFVRQNDLVQMWTFNDDGATTKAFVGLGAANTAETRVVTTTDNDAPTCSRVPKIKFGLNRADKFCRQSGSVLITADSTSDRITNVAPFQQDDSENSLTQTFACQAGAGFTFNQKWSRGGVVEATVKTSLNYRFRVSANADGPLLVDLQSWGGWTRLAGGSGFLGDRSAFSISEDEFVIQVPKMGWLHITQAGGFLRYQYALSSSECQEATCEFVRAERFQYFFENPPLPEPMGNVVTADNPLGLPPVLACPPPTLNGYNPFMYCWGWWIGPQVGYIKDWNGQPWQTSDPGCCNNLNIYRPGQWSMNRWGKMVEGKTLPWCIQHEVPPIEPPQPQTGIPVYQTDPCKDVSESDVIMFRATCDSLWGTDRNDARHISCVAQLCVTQDPTTVPAPDCRTEKLLAAMDPNHKVPETCSDCPASCNFRGKCNQNLTCTCDNGWTGPDCSQPTAYTCFTVANEFNLRPFQLLSNDKNFPHAPALSQEFYSAHYTHFKWPGDYKLPDTLFIYLAQSQDYYNARAPDVKYHLWFVSNDGNGIRDLDYDVQLDFPVRDTSNVTRIDLMGAATPGIGLVKSSDYFPKEDMVIWEQTVRFNMKHTRSQIAGAVLRNLKVPATQISSPSDANNYGVTIRLIGDSSKWPSQIVVGGASTSAKAKFDVIRVSEAQVTTGIKIQGGTCSNPADLCANLDCNSCAARTECGWCVETAQCQPGNAVGPAFGECYNWRYNFSNSINRRITQVPAYPVNPGLTEVYVTTGDTDLPISLGVVPAAYELSVWDIVVLNDFQHIPLSAHVQTFLNVVSFYGNAAVYFGAIVENGFNLVQPRVNPRATDLVAFALQKVASYDINLLAPAKRVNVPAILRQAAGVVPNALNLREGSRRAVLIMADRDHTGDALTPEIRNKLLTEGIIPVFAVPAAYLNRYQTYVTDLGFGAVILRETALSSIVDKALKKAGASVVVKLATDQDTHLNNTYISANPDKFAIYDLPTTFRAMFSLPVKSADGSTARTTTLHVPGFGSAKIENVPARGSLSAEAPWTTNNAKYTLQGGEEVVIDLTGMSFRGLLAVTPKVTALTSGQGQFYRAVRQEVDGVPQWVAGDLLSVGESIVNGKVVFKAPDTVSTGFTASLSYLVFDRCLESAPSDIHIEVRPNNRAPIADMPNLVVKQRHPDPTGWSPVDFALGFYDDNIDQGHYTFTFVDVPAETDGILYFYHNYDPAHPENSEQYKVSDGETFSTNTKQNRFLYVPVVYKHSFAAPDSPLLTLPCFRYKVAELGGDALESNVKEVFITVVNVNVPPFVWQQTNPAWPAYLLGDWPEIPTDAEGNQVCWKDCEFDEDFGHQYYWEAAPVNLYLGGNDMEGSRLNVTFTFVDCFPGALLAPAIDEATKVKAGYTIYNVAPGKLEALVRFKPLRETHTGSWGALGDAKSYYCKLSYKVSDDKGAFSNEHTITIDIKDVNKQPRFEDERVDRVAIEQKPLTFTVPVLDPEDDPIRVHFLGCAKNQGTFKLCKDMTCLEELTLDCSHLYDEANPTKKPLDISVGERTGDGDHVPMYVTFVSGPIATVTEGRDYNAYYFELDDNGHSSFPASRLSIHIDVVLINNPPEARVQDENKEENPAVYTVTVDATQSFNPGFGAYDPDFENQDFYTMTATIEVDNSRLPAARINTEKIDSLVINCRDTLVLTETHFEYKCNMPAVQEVLAGFELTAPQKSDRPTLVTVKYTLSDNGFVGQCNADVFTNALCVLTDQVVMNIEYVNFLGDNTVTIASSAAAAGVAGAAAIAAVALFRKFNRKAEESYAPWDADETDDATAVNPLYQESGAKGENPLFEARSDL